MSRNIYNRDGGAKKMNVLLPRSPLFGLPPSELYYRAASVAKSDSRTTSVESKDWANAAVRTAQCSLGGSSNNGG